MASRRVVVTGLGVVSSIGIGWESFWEALLNGRSGVSIINSFDTKGFRTNIGGEVKNFDADKYNFLSSASQYGRTSQFGIVSAHFALKDAGLKTADINENINSIVVMGTTNGESQVMEGINDKWIRYGKSQVSDSDVLKYPSNIISLNIVRALDLHALPVVIPTACAAGNYAIGYGYDKVRTGQADLAIVGGCDGFSRAAFLGFNSIFALAPTKCQPFDKNRKGIVVGEGAGTLILESMDRAISRGANIYAEVLGYGLSCDASHMTIPSQDGVVAVIKNAMASAGVSQDQIDYISAHGTGTSMNDKTESKAIRSVFGDRATHIPVSSIKSMLGHTMGAASALEAIACVLSSHFDKIPPTINHETTDEECLIDCVPNQMRQHTVNIALNNSFAFGGNNAAVVIGKHKDAK